MAPHNNPVAGTDTKHVSIFNAVYRRSSAQECPRYFKSPRFYDQPLGNVHIDRRKTNEF